MIRIIALLFAAVLSATPVLAAPAKSGSTDMQEKAAARITGSKDYVPVTNLNATVTRGFDFVGVMSVDVGLEIQDSKKKKLAQALMPRLRDALRGAVAAYVSGTYESGRVPNLDILSFRLQKAADRVMGPDVATVTIASVIIHDSR